MIIKIKKLIVSLAIFSVLFNYSELAINTANADSKEDIEKYTAKINKNPKDAGAYFNRGVAKYKLGDNKGAILDYTKAIKINPKYADAYSNRGIAKSDLGDYSGAIQDWNKAIAINPKKANAYLNRGVAKGSLRDYGGAISDFEKAKDLALAQEDMDTYEKAVKGINIASGIR